MEPQFKIADIKDAEKLTSISVDAFHTDYEVAGRREKGGPPGYDSVEFHEQMIKEATKFFKIVVGNDLVGGVWFFEKSPGHAYLHRIFIDPNFHCKDIGLKSFEFLFLNFPSIREWSLQTPIWNTRTPVFYQKLGFRVVERSDRFLLFSINMHSEFLKRERPAAVILPEADK